MNNDKKYTVMRRLQMIMPWGVAVFGAIAAFFYNKEVQYHRAGLMERLEILSRMCRIFFNITIGYGVVVVITMFVIGFIAFVVMIAHLLSSRRSEELYVKRPFSLWIHSIGCIIGTLLFMLLTMAFTYGQSV